MKVLLVIDIQNDFCPGGALEVQNGDAVVDVANKLMPLYQLVIATKDWHPANHKSFAAMHPWRKPGQVIDLNGLEQVLWPIHCVEESFGSEFHNRLDTNLIDKIFYKGTDPEVDSYSGFFDNGKRNSTGLSEFLQKKGVNEVHILGLATDYCVKFTALDAKNEGFNTFVILEGCRAVNLNEGDEDKAIREMEDNGVTIIHDLMEFFPSNSD